MQEPPTVEQLYWALGKLATDGPTRDIRENALLLLGRFTTTEAQPLDSVSRSLFDTIPGNDTFPTHQPPENIEQSREAKNIVDETYQLASKKRKPNYNDPVFECHSNYRECLDSGYSGVSCFGLLIFCLANKIIPLT